MAWLAVSRDGSEWVFMFEPERVDGIDNWYDVGSCCEDGVELPKGSIEKLTGKTLTWDDEPVEIQ